ncbi:methyltransferase-domain-containing protein [Lipomyces kononenkoae]|uniref:Methyltransferase-domain-containing protein n=1 Tax=Lipomyces kononenkoae TaxID=34357 RepID=A0ACC3T664_LIPKO
MSLFTIDGWSISAPIEAEASTSTQGATEKSTDQKKNKKKHRKNKGHVGTDSIEDNIAKIDSDKVSGEELQKLFELQFRQADATKAPTAQTRVQKGEQEVATAVDKIGTLKRKRRDGKADSKPERKVANAVKHKSTSLVEKELDNAPSPIPSANKPAPKLTILQQKMKEKLAGSRFRWINEKLYTVASDEAKNLLKDQPELYREYHEGFRRQIQSWPENPVDKYIERVKELSNSRLPPPKGLPRDKDGTTYIADMGCGDAMLSLKVSSKYSSNGGKKQAGRGHKIVVHSFDLAKTNERVTVADIKAVPLPDASVHIVVFCLALMGTNFLDFIKEANRILKPRGQLWISEIKSRFSDNDGARFINAIKTHGFVHMETDVSNLMFIRFDFVKPLSERREAKAVSEGSNAPAKKKLKFIENDSEPEDDEESSNEPLLKPCLYKKR